MEKKVLKFEGETAPCQPAKVAISQSCIHTDVSPGQKTCIMADFILGI